MAGRKPQTAGRSPQTGLRSRQAGRRRPLPEGDTLYTPDASRTRQSVEQRSAAPLVFLGQLPAWVLPVILVVLLIAGLALHGVIGAIALCGVAVVLGWLASVSWPRLSAGGRAGRVAIIALVLVVAVIQGTR